MYIMYIYVYMYMFYVCISNSIWWKLNNDRSVIYINSNMFCKSVVNLKVTPVCLSLFFKTPAHKIRGDQRSMIGRNQEMIADMSLMPITLIGHISPKKTTWEPFKSFQRSLEHKFITFFLTSATKEQLKLEIFFTSWLMLDEASSRKYEHHTVCLPFTNLFIYDNHGNRNCLYLY